MLPALAAVPRYHFLEIAVDALSAPDLDSLVEQGIAGKTRVLIGNHNLHSLYLFHQSEAMRSFYAMTDHVHADGMSIIWLARLLGYPLDKVHRTGYVDWLPRLMANAVENNWRIFYLGSRPTVLEDGMAVLRRRWPGLQIDGRHGYFDKDARSTDNQDVLNEINLYQPDLLLVGMGMPVQEQWIAENLPLLPASAIVACGALMDYVAGAIPTPPRWLGQLGLEWAFRLMTEPRRLARRYLVEPWSILGLLRKHRQQRNGNPFPRKA
jgi:N-acetylglucosaminyldiphosphoundecaprenol N-acetyl-beta-D-mannosaminyltransferase